MQKSISDCATSQTLKQMDYTSRRPHRVSSMFELLCSTPNILDLSGLLSVFLHLALSLSVLSFHMSLLPVLFHSSFVACTLPLLLISLITCQLYLVTLVLSISLIASCVYLKPQLPKFFVESYCVICFASPMCVLIGFMFLVSFGFPAQRVFLLFFRGCLLPLKLLASGLWFWSTFQTKRLCQGCLVTGCEGKTGVLQDGSETYYDWFGDPNFTNPNPKIGGGYFEDLSIFIGSDAK